MKQAHKVMGLLVAVGTTSMACGGSTPPSGAAHPDSTAKAPDTSSPVSLAATAKPCSDGGIADCEAKCEARDRGACFEAASLYGDGHGVPKNEAKAIAYLDKTCHMKSSSGDTKTVSGDVAISCVALAGASADGHKKDPAKAREALETGCSNGDAGVCDFLMTALLTGNLVPKDGARALAMSASVCDKAPDSVACITLAGVLFRGEGIPKDEKRAKALVDKACAKTAPEVCQGYKLSAGMSK